MSKCDGVIVVVDTHSFAPSRGLELRIICHLHDLVAKIGVSVSSMRNTLPCAFEDKIDVVEVQTTRTRRDSTAACIRLGHVYLHVDAFRQLSSALVVRKPSAKVAFRLVSNGVHTAPA